jgi:HD-like signal output (HDOD) protein
MDVKKQILFVDDEPNILGGLRRMLRAKRHEWDMHFAAGGEQALEILAQAGQPFDVVLSDMRMPGMDGAALLRRIMQQYPHMVRIVLSGQADRNDILYAVGPIHQYLSKPCDADTLKNALENALALGSLLPNPSLRQALSQIETLPSLPSLYADLLGALKAAEPSANDLAHIVSLDIGMSAKVLQLVNSAFFGLTRHVPGPGQAVILLGFDTLKVLGLSAEVFSQIDPARLEALSLTGLWDHSLQVSACAHEIAISQGAHPATVDYAAMAGLLHDVGKLALAAILPHQYQAALAQAASPGLSLLQAEQAAMGAAHPQAGAYLLGLWGLPRPVVEAVAGHHLPQQHPAPVFNAAITVYAANALAHELHGSGSTLDQTCLARLGLDGHIPAWRNLCEQVLKRGFPYDRHDSLC